MSDCLFWGSGTDYFLPLGVGIKKQLSWRKGTASLTTEAYLGTSDIQDIKTFVVLSFLGWFWMVG